MTIYAHESHSLKQRRGEGELARFCPTDAPASCAASLAGRRPNSARPVAAIRALATTLTPTSAAAAGVNWRARKVRSSSSGSAIEKMMRSKFWWRKGGEAIQCRIRSLSFKFSARLFPRK